MNLSQLKNVPMILGAGIGLGIIGDLLLYEQNLGVNVLLISSALLVAMLGLVMAERRRMTTANLWLIAPLLFLALFSVVRASTLLRVLNIAESLILLLLLANRLLNGPIINLGIVGYAVAVTESSFLSAILAIPLVRRVAISLRHADNDQRRTARGVIIGVVIAVPFLGIFTLLFSSADLVFKKTLDDLTSGMTLGDAFGHIFLTLGLSYIVLGMLVYTLTRQPLPQPLPANETALRSAPWSGKLGILEASIVLFSINALFLIFVVIQFAALFGGDAFLKSQGLTYSEYARTGFFQLLAVAVITLGLILALNFFTGRHTDKQRGIFLIGSSLMTILTLIILASAYKRLSLYELAYGFTRLRLYSHVFMIWLALLMIAFMAFPTAYRTRYFATGLLAFVIGFTATLDVLNPDAFIVAQNVANMRDVEHLDVDYLGSLSADAIPSLIPLLDADPAIREKIGPYLRADLNLLDRQHLSGKGWPSYHWGVDRAYRLLGSRWNDLKAFTPVPDYKLFTDPFH